MAMSVALRVRMMQRGVSQRTLGDTSKRAARLAFECEEWAADLHRRNKFASVEWLLDRLFSEMAFSLDIEEAKRKVERLLPARYRAQAGLPVST